MTSLAEIPDYLKNPDRKTEYLLWLGSKHLDPYTTKSFMSIWANATGRTFTADDWDSLLRHARRKNA
jgi:hypothetical protein